MVVTCWIFPIACVRFRRELRKKARGGEEGEKRRGNVEMRSDAFFCFFDFLVSTFSLVLELFERSEGRKRKKGICAVVDGEWEIGFYSLRRRFYFLCPGEFRCFLLSSFFQLLFRSAFWDCSFRTWLYELRLLQRLCFDDPDRWYDVRRIKCLQDGMLS